VGAAGATLVLAVGLMAGAHAGVARAAGPVTTQWLGYHGGGSGHGVAVGIAKVDTSRPEWTSPHLDGQVYGEPLVWDSEVIVATENDSVYALSPSNGTVIWRHHLATPVPAASLPCGNITPSVGITGTPVVDAGRHEVFAMAFEMSHGTPLHYLYGLDALTGATQMSVAVPTPTPDQRVYLNRSALALDQGRVVYTFGGNSGDCGDYHGVVGSVSETGRGLAQYVVDAAAGNREGAVWMGGGAPAIDSAGHVYVESGNGSVTTPGQPYDGSDGVVELSASMRVLSSFAPASWAQDNANDADLSTEPALLDNGLVVAAGKSGMSYLLRAGQLGGVGGQIAAVPSGCGDVIDGGVVVHGNIVYLPCRNGTVAMKVTPSPAGMRPIWRAHEGVGPPIMAAQLVWSIGNGVLYALAPDTGRVLRRVTLGTVVNHFATPSVGAGLLLAPLSDQVVAFSAR